MQGRYSYPHFACKENKFWRGEIVWIRNCLKYIEIIFKLSSYMPLHFWKGRHEVSLSEDIHLQVQTYGPTKSKTTTATIVTKPVLLKISAFLINRCQCITYRHTYQKCTFELFSKTFDSTELTLEISLVHLSSAYGSNKNLILLFEDTSL